MSARVIRVIEVDVTLGSGTEADPFHREKEYWSEDGELLATSRPVDWKALGLNMDRTERQT